MKKCHKYLTAFDFCYGKLEHKVMPYWLGNSSLVFQKRTNHIFHDFWIMHLDDLFIYLEDSVFPADQIQLFFNAFFTAVSILN